ncbi:hypothetical protein BCD67_09135 [Oscillatoriales cyanobacterium USR001]|nr:hypothetical protein BCD67_09135 [Oscillatoriales cyanobacterium USR001]
MRTNQKVARTATDFSVAGFTLIEILIIILILGIFSAIAAPSWLAFINNQNLHTSQDRIYWAIRIAQSNAKRDKISWQASFREQTQRTQLAVHPANIPPAQIQEIISDQLTQLKWHSLPQKIRIDTSNTTLDKVNPTNNQRPSGNVYRALFNNKGCPIPDAEDDCTAIAQGQLGRITLQHEELGKKNNRCVIVSTIIGGMRTAQDGKKTLDKGGCD